MKTILILLLAFTLQACSKKQTASPSSFKNKVVLGAFSDITSEPTLDESQLQDLPRVLDLSPVTTTVKNQSDRGTCTFFSTIALLEAAIKMDLKKEVNLSEEYLNYATKTRGYYSRVEGSEVLDNLITVRDNGLMLERDWSYQPSWFAKGFPCADYESTDRSAPAECFSHNSPGEATADKIIKNGFDLYSIKKNTTEIVQLLARDKRPMTMTLLVNFNGWPDSGETFYNEELRQECLNTTPSPCGIHSVLITGYDLDKKVFFFKNSWGRTWGNDGFGTVSFETVDNYVAGDLYVAIALPEMVIPEDHDFDNIELTDFAVSSTLEENQELKINIQSAFSGAAGKFIYFSSYLSRMKTEDVEANDANTESVRNGDDYIRAMLPFVSQSELNDFHWDNENPILLNMKIPAEVDTAGTLLRTTVYVHTDTETFKILKRLYHPISDL